VVATGSTIGGIFMNMLVAAMVSGPSAKAAGFLDAGARFVAGGLLDAVEGKGYAAWFALMACLHPIAWLILWVGGVRRMRVGASGNLR